MGRCLQRYARGLAYSPTLSLWAAVGRDEHTGNQCVMTSPDGITWTSSTGSHFKGTAGAGNDIVWAAGSINLFVAVGQSTSPTFPYAANGVVQTSPDGVTWTVASTPWDTIATGLYIGFDGTTLLATFSGSGGTYLGSSMDAVTWTDITISPGPGGGSDLYDLGASPTGGFVPYALSGSDPSGICSNGTEHRTVSDGGHAWIWQVTTAGVPTKYTTYFRANDLSRP